MPLSSKSSTTAFAQSSAVTSQSSRRRERKANALKSTRKVLLLLLIGGRGLVQQGRKMRKIIILQAFFEQCVVLRVQGYFLLPRLSSCAGDKVTARHYSNFQRTVKIGSTFCSCLRRPSMFEINESRRASTSSWAEKRSFLLWLREACRLFSVR